ncbi:hypothetical protein [Methanococcoides seepicolus]|uniref:Site-specific integrase n=1 Tax=Methanococcoides seepicolus TaxID=2828780 RepID=A0A9E4ZEQ9_9EURY|nr:hypothetical protein [Methanococcoides seepicolus]MCM1986297.1 site-specific integrase [Methanococcoides seepicolus]
MQFNENKSTVSDYEALANEKISEYLSFANEFERKMENFSLFPEEAFSSYADVFPILEAANQTGKTFITILADSGARISELETLCIKDVQFDGELAKINVVGSMKPKWINLTYSSLILKGLLLMHHPLHSGPSSPLWINLETDRYGETLSSEDLRNIVADAGEKAAWGQEIIPYLLS